MPRSLKLHPSSIPIVKSALLRNGFPSQKILAEDLGIAQSTVSNFLNGKPVDYANFIEICQALGQEWRNIADLSDLSADRELELCWTNVSSETVEELPMPNTLPELPEGQVELASRFYIERPPIEARCYETIIQPGALIRIKAPRQMGKTSLMSRILHCAERQGSRAIALNFQLASKQIFTDLDTFLQWFCAGVGLALGQLDSLSNSWHQNQIQKLMDLVGGHPFLVRLAMYHISRGDITINRLAQESATEAGIYSDHLRRHLWNLDKHPEIKLAFGQVVTAKSVRLPSEHAFKCKFIVKL